MKRIVFVFGLMFLVFTVAVHAQTSAQTQAGSVEQELIKLETEWSNAWVKPDIAFLDQILADDWVFTDPDGNVLTKAQDIAAIKSGEYVFTSAVADEMKVRVYGNAAVVSGRFTAKETLKGKDVSGQVRFTDTFIKRAGRWQCVATHASRIAQK